LFTTKYTDEFIKSAVQLYMDDPCVTQAQLAKRLHIPLGTLQSWLKCKVRGLTPFQRAKRNRDNLIRTRYAAAQARIKKVRENRDRLADDYGITRGYLRILANKKTNN
jgi:hypothetical protein